MKQQIIHYGIGKDYLPNWGLQQAFREIYQNFLDFGEYKVDMSKEGLDEGLTNVTITNGYTPETLEFLRIGTSNKNGNPNAIGKHGEGLKMAILIFARMDLFIVIKFGNKHYTPIFTNNGGIESCFAIKVTETIVATDKFTIDFVCDTKEHAKFYYDIIQEKDIIFNSFGDGSIVNRMKGRIYSGGLFITECKNLSRAYDINPSNMELDRDRSVPRTIDVNYHSSAINARYDKWTLAESEYDDTQHIYNIPQRIKEQVKPILVGTEVQFTYKDGEEEKVIHNNSIINSLRSDSLFSKIIRKLKQAIIRHLGLYDILLEFKTKHLLYRQDALEDFDIILEQVKAGAFEVK